jgi:hypothetical protein
MAVLGLGQSVVHMSDYRLYRAGMQQDAVNRGHADLCTTCATVYMMLSFSQVCSSLATFVCQLQRFPVFSKRVYDLVSSSFTINMPCRTCYTPVRIRCHRHASSPQPQLYQLRHPHIRHDQLIRPPCETPHLKHGTGTGNRWCSCPASKGE